MSGHGNDHYYTADPHSASRPAECTFTYRGAAMRFQTDAGVFSRGEVDPGTRLLLEALPETLAGDILDLGCGWGVIGVSIARTWPEARVTMADVNRRALELSRKNAAANGVKAECQESDGFSALRERRFDMVVTNPPIRAGKHVIYRMFADAAGQLKSGGALYLVIRKQQGAESCLRYLGTLFQKAEKLDRSGGYWVIRARDPLPGRTDETKDNPNTTGEEEDHV